MLCRMDPTYVLELGYDMMTSSIFRSDSARNALLYNRALGQVF